MTQVCSVVMRHAGGHIDSYYVASAAIAAPRPPLLGRLSVDVCVVGGGIAGCTTALELAERGYRVALVESCRLGWAASGRNGGQVLPGYAKGQGPLEKAVGASDAMKMWELSVAAVQQLRARIDRHRIDCHWVSGELYVADKPRQIAELREWRDELEGKLAYGGTRLMERAELAATVASGRYLAALYDPAAGHLHPLRYTLGLAEAAAAAGAQLFEHCEVLRHERGSDGRLRVHTRSRELERAHPEGAGAGIGEIDCEHLVYAGGATLGAVVPALARKIMPIGTYIVATEPLEPERAESLVRNNAAVADLNWIIDYFRRSADHRLLFGGRVSYSGLRHGDTQRATRERMLRVFPQLEDVRIDYSWGGYLDITMNRLPHFGRLDRGVWFLQGFCGHGVALTGMAGRLVAEAIAGNAERFDMFGRIRHRDFPGGPALRRPALVLAMLWYRLRDLY